jgi:hypothetical protein
VLDFTPASACVCARVRVCVCAFVRVFTNQFSPAGGQFPETEHYKLVPLRVISKSGDDAQATIATASIAHKINSTEAKVGRRARKVEFDFPKHSTCGAAL